MIIPVTWMLHAWIPLDHMYVNAMLDILEMDETAQVILISSLQYLEKTCMTRLTTAPHHAAALQDKLIIYYSWLVLIKALVSHGKNFLGNVPEF